MSDAATSTNTTDRTKRVLAILTIGLAAICLVQFVKGQLDARACAQEQRTLTSPRATLERFHNLFYNSPRLVPFKRPQLV